MKIRFAVLAVVLSAIPAWADDVDTKLDAVAMVHGDAGAWAVAGFRMGEHALKTLGLKRGSFSLAVEHQSPREVRYACIADGAQAATGASVGRLQLSFSEAKVDKIATVYTNKETGKSVKLRPTAAFMKKFMEVPREKARVAGREAMTMSDAEVFEVVP
jgi:formylmethanofuran dehydrogenase subunit E